MSELRVIVRPELVVGFQLAGVEAYAADDVEKAEELIGAWLDEDREGLVAIDEGLLAEMSPDSIRRLESAEHLHYIPIPGGDPSGAEISRQQRITEMIRNAIGFKITFGGRESGEAEEG